MGNLTDGERLPGAGTVLPAGGTEKEKILSAAGTVRETVHPVAWMAEGSADWAAGYAEASDESPAVAPAAAGSRNGAAAELCRRAFWGKQAARAVGLLLQAGEEDALVPALVRLARIYSALERGRAVAGLHAAANGTSLTLPPRLSRLLREAAGPERAAPQAFAAAKKRAAREMVRYVMANCERLMRNESCTAREDDR